MTTEGGGKLRQKRARNTKPYQRPKSVINRVTDAFRTVFNPSWITGLVPSWSQADAANEDDESERQEACVDADAEEDGIIDVELDQSPPPSLTAAPQLSQRQFARSQLNAVVAGPSGYVPPPPLIQHPISGASTSTSSGGGFSGKPRLPVDTLPAFRHADDHRLPLHRGATTSTTTTNAGFPSRLTSTPVNSFLLSSSLLPDQHGRQQLHPGSDPSAGTPFALAAAFSQQLRQQQRDRDAAAAAAAAGQLNGVGGDQSSAVSHPRPVSAASSSGSGARHFAKLSNIGKLPGAEKKSSSRPESAASADGSGRKLDQLDSTHLPGDSHSECSEESVSTSGCSSMIPHPDKRDYQRDVLQLGKPALQKLSEDLQSTIPTGSQGGSDWDRTNTFEDRSSVKSPSFLWSETMGGPSKSSRPQQTGNSSKPRFNATLFSTSVLPDNSVLNGSSFAKNMKVSYGFGSSYRSKLSALNPYDAGSRRKQVQVKNVASSSSGAESMSTTAKRILETLEKMNTPLMDAKKIPPNRPSALVAESPLTFMQTSFRRRPCLANKGIADIKRAELSVASTSQGPPTRNLMTPGASAVTRTNYLRKFDANQTQNLDTPSTSQASGSSVLSPASTNATRPTDTTSNRGGGGGKIKNVRKDTLHYSSKHLDDDEVTAMPELPSIPLPIRNLPVFNLLTPSGGDSAVKPLGSATQPVSFSAAAASAASHRSSNGADALSQLSRVQPDVTKTPVTSASTPNAYSFTSPMTSSPFATPVARVRGQEFTFSSPIPVGETPTPPHTALPKNSSAPSTSVNFAFLPTTTSTGSGNSASPISTLARPRATVPVVTLSSPAASSSSSLSSSATLKSPASTPDLSARRSTGVFVASPAAQLKTTGSVMDVLGKMASSASRTTVTASTGTSSSVAPATSTWGNQFKPAANTWECPTCMVRNNEDKSKCASCDTDKPVKKPNVAQPTSQPKVSAAPPPSSDLQFAALAASQSARDKWECPSCMLRVDNSASKCPACTADRPGASPSIKSAAATTSGAAPVSASAPAVSTASLSAFAAGADKWECGTCLVRNANALTKCSACETDRPGAAKTSSAGSATSTAAQSFKFGISAQAVAPASAATTTTSVTGFKFGLSTTSGSQSTPAASATTTTSGFSLAPSTVATPASNLFKFGVITPSTDPASDKSTTKEGTAVTFRMPVAADATKSSAKTEAQSTPSPVVPIFGAVSSPATKPSPAGESASTIEFKLPTAPPALDVTTATVTTSTTVPTTTTFAPINTAAAKPFAPPTIGTGFSFGATPTSTPATNTTGGFAFQFGSKTANVTADTTKLASTTKADAAPKLPTFATSSPSASPAPPSISLGTTGGAPPPANQSGGFQFSFAAAKTDAAPSSGGVSLKRGNDADELCPSSSRARLGSARSTQSGPTATTTSATGGLPAFGGFAAPSAAPSSGAFVFGAGNSAATNAAPVFGALGAQAAIKPPSSTFSFGGASTAAPQTSSLFANNSSANSSAPSAFASGVQSFGSTGSSAGFAFGASATQSTATNSGAPAGSFGAGSVFGATGATQSVTPMFGAGGSANAGSAFGGAPAFAAPGANQPGSQPFGQNFNFGAAASAGASSPFGGAAIGQPPGGGVFQFSGGQGGAASQSSGPGFGFGQSMASNQQQVAGAMPMGGGFSFDPASPVNLNFNPGGQQQQQLPTFSAAPNPFDAQQTANRTGRTIKKARRRTQLK